MSAPWDDDINRTPTNNNNEINTENERPDSENARNENTCTTELQPPQLFWSSFQTSTDDINVTPTNNAIQTPTGNLDISDTVDPGGKANMDTECW